MRYLNLVLSNSLAVVLLLVAMQSLVFPLTAFSQDEGLTFEQAQTRTTYSRRQMESARRALADAESREEESLGRLAILRKQIEEARLAAEKATAARETVQKEHTQAKEKWRVESERLKRLHQRKGSGSTGR